MNINNEILSDITVHMKYAKYIPELNRRETWEELVDRNKQMHIRRYPGLENDIETYYKYVYEKKKTNHVIYLPFVDACLTLNK